MISALTFALLARPFQWPPLHEQPISDTPTSGLVAAQLARYASQR